MRGEVETLYRQCAPAVYKYLLCLTHDQALAEDLTADTFERALSGFERFRGDCTPTAWLCAIARRLWYGELRRKRQALPLSEEFPKNETGMLTLIPGRHDTDGFFISRMRRKP